MKLNEQQLAVVNATEKHILCIAGAGTGKTASLIERLKKLVQDGVDPKSILVLTFTNAAAFEMKTRYEKFSKNSPEFRTFHAFCYSLLRNDPRICKSLGYSSVPDIAKDEDVLNIRRSAQLQLSIKIPDNVLNGKKVPTPMQERQIELIRKAERRLLKKSNLITFDSLCYDICKLFEDDNEIIKKYKNKYSHIMIDEFQDTDPKQWAFAKSFKNANLFVIGDAQQACYSFRGADNSIIKALSVDDDWKVYKLEYNYRSTMKICELANKASSHAEPSYRLNIKSSRSGGIVGKYTLPYNDSGSFRQYGKVDQTCLSFCIEEVPKLSGTSAILCRTNKEVYEISQQLKANKIMHKTNADTDDIESLLKCCIDDTFFEGYISSKLSSTAYSEYIRECGIFQTDRLGIDHFCRFISNINVDSSITDTIGKIVSGRLVLSSSDDFITKYKNLKTLFGFEKLVDILKIDSNEMLIDSLTADSISEDSQTTNIYVGTIHSSKGLEYDNVVLVGVGGPTFILTNEENRNLYYIGITRAKTNLYVYEVR